MSICVPLISIVGSPLLDKVRVLYDRSQSTARIVVRDKEDLEEPLVCD